VVLVFVKKGCCGLGFPVDGFKDAYHIVTVFLNSVRKSVQTAKPKNTTHKKTALNFFKTVL